MRDDELVFNDSENLGLRLKSLEKQLIFFSKKRFLFEDPETAHTSDEYSYRNTVA